MTSNIILFATYWNEIDWIKLSLRQIEKINPKEVIICDGCFDEKYPPYSTDGTREIIKSWIRKRTCAKRLISPVRKGKFRAILSLFKAHSKLPKKHFLFPSRYLSTMLKAKKSSYRINQALTFNKMISMSKEWRVGGWFMNYDCDQFYSDSMIKKIKNLTSKKNSYGLLTGEEKTFFNSFKTYTTQYEKRNFNNMPHKIYPNTWIAVTRVIVRESFFVYRKYIDCVKSKNLGTYYHYKFKFSNNRLNEGYNLGDRIKPDISAYAHKKFNIKNHPSLISNFIKSL